MTHDPTQDICPIFGAAAVFSSETTGTFLTPLTVNCKGSRCAWFATITTIEGYGYSGCAIKLLVGQNKDGRMSV